MVKTKASQLPKIKRMKVYTSQAMSQWVYETEFKPLAFSLFKSAYKPTYGFRFVLFNKQFDVTIDLEKYHV